MTALNTRAKKPASASRQSANGPATVGALKPAVIRCRAYEIYLDRKGGPGDAVSDWNQAERELKRSAGVLAADREGRAPGRSKDRARGDGNSNNHD